MTKKRHNLQVKRKKGSINSQDAFSGGSKRALAKVNGMRALNATKKSSKKRQRIAFPKQDKVRLNKVKEVEEDDQEDSQEEINSSQDYESNESVDLSKGSQEEVQLDENEEDVDDIDGDVEKEDESEENSEQDESEGEQSDQRLEENEQDDDIQEQNEENNSNDEDEVQQSYEDDVERDENGRKKIYRRKADQIEKDFTCKVRRCRKQYGSYPALYTHLKTKHEELGIDKLYKMADRERMRIIKLEEYKSSQPQEENEDTIEESQEGDEEDLEKMEEESEGQIDERRLKKESKKDRQFKKYKLKMQNKKNKSNSQNENQLSAKSTEKIRKNGVNKELAGQQVQNGKRVKEFYVQEYMHLIKPDMVNKKKIKELMKSTKRMQLPNCQEQSLEEIMRIRKKGPGRPKKKSQMAIRRTFGSVEQMIQKSINKQLALAEIKKQQRNLKLQKIDKNKLNELNVFQPQYLLDLLRQIEISSKQIHLTKPILVESLPFSFKYEENSNDHHNLINGMPNGKSNENSSQLQNKSTKYAKTNDKKLLKKGCDCIEDYPEITEQNSFLVEPLKKQLEYLMSQERVLGNEEIQGIGLRLAYSLRFLSIYSSKQFYQELVYFTGYLLRVLSIKKAVQYNEVLQDFLSIYEYIMNSIQYGGFTHCFPIFSQFTDLQKVYNFPKNIILSILKLVFKSNNAYSQNLQQQYYHFNQAQPSIF